MTRFEFSLYS